MELLHCTFGPVPYNTIREVYLSLFWNMFWHFPRRHIFKYSSIALPYYISFYIYIWHLQTGCVFIDWAVTKQKFKMPANANMFTNTGVCSHWLLVYSACQHWINGGRKSHWESGYSSSVCLHKERELLNNLLNLASASFVISWCFLVFWCCL